MSLEIHIGHCAEVLRTLDTDSCQCCVTSPPYWGLRDYGADRQIGFEETFDEWLQNTIAVFREMKRVLKPDGTLWVNMGDSYGRQRGSGFLGNRKLPASSRNIKIKNHLRQKNLMGQPWRLAFALQDDGWILRRDYIWHKPNCCPESCKDRGTTAHEYVFQFALLPRYYFDQEAVKEPVSGNAHARGRGVNPKAKANGPNSRLTVDRVPNSRKPNPSRHNSRPKQNSSFSAATKDLVETRNMRSVWTIANQAYRGAHFATFPTALAERCIRAGSRVGDTIIDPFAGSGTTGEASKRLNRKAILIDVNPDYKKLMLERCHA